MDNDLKIKNFIDEYLIRKAFTCVSVGILYKNKGKRDKLIIYNGNNCKNEKISVNIKTFFDLASLTKPFATVFSILSLIKNNKLSIDSDIKILFECSELNKEKEFITVEQLLSHSAGFPAHKNYFEELVKVSIENRKELLFKLLMDEPLVYKPGCKVIYSDLGYMLLGLIIEKISGEVLDDYSSKMIFGPVGLADHIFYNPVGSQKHSAGEFAAVEYCPWRCRPLQGEVSDENCWALGGVAGHAGLYGDISGVLDLTELILDVWTGKRSHPNINSDNMVSFLKKREKNKDNSWALGFDTPTPGKSSSGKYLSTTSVGHLGYTGTSFWIDPERELAIVILSNRVHPSRDNELIRQFRPALHDKVVEWLGLQVI